MPALGRARKTKTKAKATAPRRRVTPRWVKPVAIGAGALLLVGGVTTGSMTLWKNLSYATAAAHVHERIVAATASFGLVVNDVLVEGRGETPREDIFAALAVARGTPMLDIDPAAARERIEELPWVKTAVVERQLPDTIFVRLVERVPLALWQKDGKLALVDSDGRVLTRDNLSRFRDLPIVIGDDAPRAARTILGLLAAEPDLYRRIESLTYVSARRWDVHLAGDIEVQLPETDPGRAWARLAETDRREQLLARDISVVDMRLPDRLTVRLAHPPADAPKPGKKGKSA
ncbi:MAG TPA: cell division protein FtsQ/DivIB [Alphaproteobacteria bacterium]|nr:cell division protein FtsQ/DivIB [Alphaproteobacteria bacterium]